MKCSYVDSSLYGIIVWLQLLYIMSMYIGLKRQCRGYTHSFLVFMSKYDNVYGNRVFLSNVCNCAYGLLLYAHLCIRFFVVVYCYMQSFFGIKRELNLFQSYYT